MLGCSVPEAAVVKPGSSNMTHDPWSISARLRETSCLSVFTRISLPARTVLWLPVILKSLPLRLRTIGCWAAAPPRPPGAPPLAAPGPPGPPFAAPGAGPLAAPGPPGPPLAAPGPAFAAPAAGRFPPIPERKANRAVRVSILTLAPSSPLLSERFRRPTSPVHTEAFQVGWILQVL